MPDTILVIGGGIESIPGIKIIHDMGLRVVCTDINFEAPAFAVADDHLIASTYDVACTSAVAAQYSREVSPIRGVIALGSDVPLTVAQVAHRLNLPHIPLRAALVCSNKLLMKNVLKNNRVRIPYYQLLDSEYQLHTIVTSDTDKLYVIKPVDSRGARGVMRMLPGVNIFKAYHESMKYSTIVHQVLIEEWLDGPQISTEGIVLSGKYYHVATVDRNYARLKEFAPYCIEDGGSQPSYLCGEGHEAVYLDIVHQLQIAATAIGMDNGTLKGDIVIHNSQPYIIEVAPRLSGGYLSSVQIPLATGVNIIQVAVNLATDKSVTPDDLKQRKDTRGVAIRYFFPKTGIFRGIDLSAIVDSAFTPYLAKYGIFLEPGDAIENPKSHPERAGFVIMVGATAKEAIARAEYMIKNTGFIMESA